MNGVLRRDAARGRSYIGGMSDGVDVSRAIGRQFAAFFGVGLVAAVVHYGLLVGLVEGGVAGPVPATLAGYVAGGLVSYALNRRHTYRSRRPHAEAGWRFALVALVGFGLTGGLMHAFTNVLGAPYLPAQVVTTGIVLLWSFAAHRLWTFGAASPRQP
jgi:putative flippase GtrA